MALQAIGTRKAKRALHAGAMNTNSNAQRITLMNALAELKYANAHHVFKYNAKAEGRDVRFTALFGLAQLGMEGDEPILKAATQSGSNYDKIEAKSLYELYMRNAR